jgi:flagellar protein FlbD
MIEVSRLNKEVYLLNSDLIKMIESTPDTLITLTTGEKIMVRESVDTILERTMNYRKRLYQEPPVSKILEEKGNAD